MKFLIILHAGSAIHGGKVVIGVSYVGVPVHSETIDLCKEVSCPVANGNFVISHTQTLPSITPPMLIIEYRSGIDFSAKEVRWRWEMEQGPYTLKMTLKDDNGDLLTCIKFNFKIVLFSSLVSDM
ncbi:hypothetical protein TSUD_272620 [Trifolium subterraneum]|uniref:MD-2-related lipid-recognition domain-containing protein n=1 Tax=Trifolium subterraneum TaxID=3900 RepID=A0A2Z6NAB6_TRISU|nr:hypothetical protein TSUD_272620 [Trifolium subterraneum]